MGEIPVGAVIAFLALVVAVSALLIKVLDKSLSLREHNEFKESIRSQLERITRHQEERLVIREFTEWREQINRDIDRIEEDLRLIDQTKPTTGELQMAAKAIEARIVVIEERLRAMLKKNGIVA